MYRYISYIYEYAISYGDVRNQSYSKCGNKGFCKIWEDKGKAKVQICFKEMSLDKKRVDIYKLVFDGNICQVGEAVSDGMMVNGQLRQEIEFDTDRETDSTCRYGILVRQGAKVYAATSDCGMEEIIIKEAEEKETEEKETEEKEAEEKGEELTRVYNRFGKVRMMFRNKEYPVVKLRLQDMMMLPRRYWRLASNCFIMESCYRNGYIFLFRYKEKYVLAVESKGCIGEESYAWKYGFKESVEGCLYGCEKNIKRYWLKEL